MTGQYAHTIDAKGRLFIPAALRKELGQTFHITVGQDRCLSVYSDESWAAFMDKLKALAKIYDVSLDWLCSDADEMEGRDKQPTKKQEATEINEDKQQSAVQNKSRQKKVGIVVVIIIFGMLLLGWLVYQKEKVARPMEDMTSKTIEPEESENTESFDFGW